MTPAANPHPAPCPPDRLRLVLADDDRESVLRALLTPENLRVPHLSDPTPEAGLLEDLLLAAASLGLRLPELDAVAPASPAPGEVLRRGSRVTEHGAVEPAEAAELYRSGADRDDALLLLRRPSRLVARHPELIPAFREGPLAALLAPWCRKVHNDAMWPWMSVAVLPEASPGHGILPGDRVASHLGDPAALTTLLRAAEAPAGRPDHGVRLEQEAITLGRWLVSGADAPLWKGAAVGRELAAALLESPFFGADAELLGARLAAVRGQQGLHRLELRPEILPLMVAIWKLVKLNDELEAALRALACRPANAAERQLRPVDRHDPISGDLPLLPPQAARTLLQRHGALWFDALSTDARAEVLDALATGPTPETSWIWPAVFRHARTREGGGLTATEAAGLLTSWRRAIVEASGEDLPRVVMGGLALGPRLDDADQRRLLSGALTTNDRWRVGLVHLVAERAPAARQAATDALIDLLRGADRPLRVPAAVALLRLVREGHLGASTLDAIEPLLDPELRRHPDVVDEWRRLGRGS